jgi:hypothetical protein
MFCFEHLLHEYLLYIRSQQAFLASRRLLEMFGMSGLGWRVLAACTLLIHYISSR